MVRNGEKEGFWRVGIVGPDLVIPVLPNFKSREIAFCTLLGSHDMRSCYRSTASETVAPNRVTVTEHRGPITNRGPKIFKMKKISKFF